MRRGEAVRPHDIHVSLRRVTIVRPCRLARAEKCVQQHLQILNVGRRMIIQDHEIDGELFHSPILVRAEQLPHDAHVLGLVDLNEHDREVS